MKTKLHGLFILFSLMSCGFWIEPTPGTQKTSTRLVRQHQLAANTAAECLSRVEGIKITIDASDFSITEYTATYEMFGRETSSHFLPPGSIYYTTEILPGCQAQGIGATFLPYEFVRAYVVNIKREFTKNHRCFTEMEELVDQMLKTDGVICGYRLFKKK